MSCLLTKREIKKIHVLSESRNYRYAYEPYRATVRRSHAHTCPTHGLMGWKMSRIKHTKHIVTREFCFDLKKLRSYGRWPFASKLFESAVVLLAGQSRRVRSRALVVIRIFEWVAVGSAARSWAPTERECSIVVVTSSPPVVRQRRRFQEQTTPVPMRRASTRRLST